ncbi:MAG: hypothetical protein DID90_2727553902 [Candidatus Nitrotoga sp. LAW]|nr:MAG: hypothetical protein DID90_2727553902 [Candidatus Nitrotoga sp. LAW]
MKQIIIRLLLVFFSIFLVGISASQSAFGHGGPWYGGGWGGGGRVGIYLGAPIGFNFGFSPYSYYRAPYYGSPYSYSPAPVYYPSVQQPPQVIYTERRVGSPLSSQESSTNSVQNVQNSWWYYCTSSNAYYPYIKKCPGGWLRVVPQPVFDK